MLQLFRQNIRGVGPEVGSEVFFYIRLSQLRKVIGQFRFGGAPSEVRVRLRKPQFGQVLHDLRSGEGFR